MLSEQNAALHLTMEQEAEALAKLLSTPDRCVMVLVIVAHDTSNNAIDYVHAISGDTTTKHVSQFLRALESKYHWLKTSLRQIGKKEHG